VGLCFPLSLLGNDSVKTFPRQRRIDGLVVFYVVRVLSEESRGWVLPRPSCLSKNTFYRTKETRQATDFFISNEYLLCHAQKILYKRKLSGTSYNIFYFNLTVDEIRVYVPVYENSRAARVAHVSPVQDG
jgi:hypothetical protein